MRAASRPRRYSCYRRGRGGLQKKLAQPAAKQTEHYASLTRDHSQRGRENRGRAATVKERRPLFNIKDNGHVQRGLQTQRWSAVKVGKIARLKRQRRASLSLAARTKRARTAAAMERRARVINQLDGSAGACRVDARVRAPACKIYECARARAGYRHDPSTRIRPRATKLCNAMVLTDVRETKAE